MGSEKTECRGRSPLPGSARGVPSLKNPLPFFYRAKQPDRDAQRRPGVFNVVTY